MKNPFTILAISDHADDETIREAFNAQLQAFPQERFPQRYREIQAAFHALQDRRLRMRQRLFGNGDPDLTPLWTQCLRYTAPRRPTQKTFRDLMAESLSEYRFPDSEKS
ncbi:MAG: hypothetical protein HQL52_09330 [Magnetococcales bacterium]|nr:hypothetical protein [Magnetococcales bacterium]